METGTISNKSSFIPLSEPDLTGNEKKYLNTCIDENWVSSAGHYVGTFEEKIAIEVEAAMPLLAATALWH